jgi:DNA-binding IclR family transcriptional regulator
LDRDEYGNYHVGARLLLIARKYEQRWTLSPTAEAALEELRNETLETVAIYVRVGFERILLASKESPQLLRCWLDPNRRWPLNRGSAGRLLLSMMPDRAIRDYLHRIGESDGLLEQVAEIRKVGYSMGLAETVPGVGSISVPIAGPDGQSAALTLVVPLARFEEQPLTGFLPLMVEKAEAIAESWAGARNGRPTQHAGAGR